MLSAAGCIAAATDTVAFDRLDATDTAYAYLPLAWVGDHYLNYAQGLVAGFCLACPESRDTALTDLREIGPTYFFAPPRVFEEMLTRVTIRTQDASRIKRALFDFFIGVARRHGEKLLNRQPVPPSGRVLYAVGKLVIYAPLMNALGLSRVRVAYTAGEAIGPELFSFFRALGLNLKQLYGQTEAFLYVTAQPDGQIFPRHRRLRRPPCDPAHRRLGRGAIPLARHVRRLFQGCGRDGSRADGRRLCENRRCRLHRSRHRAFEDHRSRQGRWESIHGSLFAPKYLEKQAEIFSRHQGGGRLRDGRPFAAVMLEHPILPAVGDWAERNGIVYGSYQELAGHPRVYDLLAQHVAEVNRGLSAEPVMAGAQIKRFLTLPKELDADDGEVTRTQKVRRGFVAARYAPLIAALYDGAAAADIATEVTFEDGRRGTLAARVTIRDMDTASVAPALGEAA